MIGYNYQLVQASEWNQKENWTSANFKTSRLAIFHLSTVFKHDSSIIMILNKQHGQLVVVVPTPSQWDTEVSTVPILCVDCKNNVNKSHISYKNFHIQTKCDSSITNTTTQERTTGDTSHMKQIYNWKTNSHELRYFKFCYLKYFARDARWKYGRRVRQSYGGRLRYGRSMFRTLLLSFLRLSLWNQRTFWRCMQ